MPLIVINIQKIENNYLTNSENNSIDTKNFKTVKKKTILNFRIRNAIISAIKKVKTINKNFIQNPLIITVIIAGIFEAIKVYFNIPFLDIIMTMLEKLIN